MRVKMRVKMRVILNLCILLCLLCSLTFCDNDTNSDKSDGSNLDLNLDALISDVSLIGETDESEISDICIDTNEMGESVESPDFEYMDDTNPLDDNGKQDVIVDEYADTSTDRGYEDMQSSDMDSDSDSVVDTGTMDDTGIVENYDRMLVVTHPYGQDGSSCGRDIEFFRFTAMGDMVRLNRRIEVGDCPIKVRFSPDGNYLFVILNNDHNPQAGTQSVVLLKKSNSEYVRFKQFDEFSMQNPEYLVFDKSGNKLFVVDYDIKGQGGIHIIQREQGDWNYKREIPFTLPRAMVVMPDNRYALIIGGEEPGDVAIMDIIDERIVKEYDIFSDFVDSLGLDVTPDGRYVVVPNSSPFSNIGNTLSLLEITYENGVPVPTLVNTVENVNEPSASLFSTDARFVVVTNFSKNYISLFEINNSSLTFRGRVTSMSLADSMTMIRRGDFKDFFFISALNDIFVLRIENENLVIFKKLGLGDGYENMLGDIDIEP
jgi:6-phosphogluconolactonase (cycloisomerase 2 family)